MRLCDSDKAVMQPGPALEAVGPIRNQLTGATFIAEIYIV